LIFRNFTAAILILFAIPPLIFAQSLTLPVLSENHAEFSMSVQGGLSRIDVSHSKNNLYFAIARPAFGLWRSLDIFAIIGGMQQHTDYVSAEFSDYRSSSAVIYGGGATVLFSNEGPFKSSLFLSGQIMRFTPDGSIYNQLVNQNTGFKKRHDIEYQWTNIEFAAIAAKKVHRLELISGISFLQQKAEHSTQRILANESTSVPVGNSEGPFLKKSALFFNAGVMLHLPGRHRLGLHFRSSGNKDFGIFLSLSQTGSPQLGSGKL